VPSPLAFSAGPTAICTRLGVVGPRIPRQKGERRRTGIFPLKCESMGQSSPKVRWLRMTARITERVSACSSQAESGGPAIAGPQAPLAHPLCAGFQERALNDGTVNSLRSQGTAGEASGPVCDHHPPLQRGWLGSADSRRARCSRHRSGRTLQASMPAPEFPALLERGVGWLGSDGVNVVFDGGRFGCFPDGWWEVHPVREFDEGRG
jgi:hypothetical protein